MMTVGLLGDAQWLHPPLLRRRGSGEGLDESLVVRGFMVYRSLLQANQLKGTTVLIAIGEDLCLALLVCRNDYT